MRTLVLGASLRGLSDVARISVAEGADVVLYDAESPAPPPDLVGLVEVLPTQWQPKFLDGIDRVITSPWFPETRPPLLTALDRGIDIITEAGFGLERIETPFVAVTGTNGKSTVTELAAEMLTASGIHAEGAGNLGRPVSSMTDTDAAVLVLELSSYQLRFLGDAVPIAAALLNIAPDHLDWHGSFERYVDAKARVFAGMGADAVLAFNADDPVVASTVATAVCRLVPCSGVRVPAEGNGVERGRLIVNGFEFDTPTTDPSFLFDLVAASTVAFVAGASVEGVQSAIDAFRPGAHRRQVVRTSDGILWIDDSKATNPHATAAAVAALRPVVLLAGGQNKGLDLTTLGVLEGVTNLIAFGEAGPSVAQAAREPVSVVDTLEDAVRVARTVAGTGDTVLLSPGCASFDQYGSYAERGDDFQRLVRGST